ncbi:MAG: molybdenum cofactor biosynthesis protein MoaE [Propionibacteriaceae bacterium]|jgi:molybdopterin synthase catalytic subunit|nr:molybdenum cofactor biosynthesis protein MoaE [Propionibacteriaceae bacterium]
MILAAEITAEPIDVAALLELVRRREAGATNVFIGHVRNNDRHAAGEVVALEYSCHPTAGERLRELIDEALRQVDPDGVAHVAAAHRIGALGVGEVAFVVAASAPHRELAFAACQRVVETVKHNLPVWKKQYDAQGASNWQGL